MCTAQPMRTWGLPMSSIVSMRLRGEQWARLERYARTPGKSSGETSALLVEERLRESESAFIEFRHSPSGRPIAWARAALSDHEAYRREREEQGISHGGVVFVDERSVSRQDRGSGTNDRTVAGPWPAGHREALRPEIASSHGKRRSSASRRTESRCHYSDPCRMMALREPPSKLAQRHAQRRCRQLPEASCDPVTWGAGLW